MQLKNFNRYDFIIRDGALIVRNKETKHLLTPTRDDHHYTRKFNLRDDNGNKASVGELRIAYCLLNHCDLSSIKSKVVVGTVKQPRLKSQTVALPADEAMKKVLEIEFCLEKLKHYYLTGDMSFFIEYAHSSHTKYQAIATVHKFTAVPMDRLDMLYGTAVDSFIDTIKRCDFTSIKPLFGILCKCLKVAYFRDVKPNKNIKWIEKQ